MAQIQSVHFSKSYWTRTTAMKKLDEMGLVPIKMVHATPNYLEYRILNPKLFKRFSTLRKRNGIQLVMGFKS